MKKTALIIFAFFSLHYSTDAQTLKVPAPSPTSTVKQDFALGNIEISYSRPAIKGRTVFGDLVPFDKVWRTGANSATTLNFSDTVMIGGKKVSPGKYGFVTIPGQSEWTLIISKSTSITSPSAYKMEEDVVRVMAKTAAVSPKVENFTIQIGNITAKSCDIQLIWDNVMVSLPVTAEIDSRIMSDIDKAINQDSRPYFSAANYYQDNGKDLNKAIEWYDKAIAANPKAFYMVYQKANTLSKLGKKKEALAAAQQSLALSKEAENDDYVKLNEKLIKTLQ